MIKILKLCLLFITVILFFFLYATHLLTTYLFDGDPESCTPLLRTFENFPFPPPKGLKIQFTYVNLE